MFPLYLLEIYAPKYLQNLRTQSNTVFKGKLQQARAYNLYVSPSVNDTPIGVLWVIEELQIQLIKLRSTYLHASIYPSRQQH